MRYDVLLAPSAVEHLRRLKANVRTAVRDAIEQHLRHEPAKLSKGRIKRLRGLSHPQYRLRVEDVRVFYDVTESAVEILAICPSQRPKPGFLKRAKPRQNRVKQMKKVALSDAKDDLSKYLRMAEKEAIVITRHGKPAGVLIGFADEDDWFDYRLENDPRFLKRIAAAREGLRVGKGVRLEDVV